MTYYNVVLERKSTGVCTWTSFDDKAHFEKWFNNGCQHFPDGGCKFFDVKAQGISEEQCERICDEVSIENHIREYRNNPIGPGLLNVMIMRSDLLSRLSSDN